MSAFAGLLSTIILLVHLSSVQARPLEVPGSPRLFAESIGRGVPVIIVIHGGPGVGHDYLRPELDALSEFGRVVYYDQRGCGRSERRGPYTWQAHLIDLDRIVNLVEPGRGRVVLVGSSWGATLALLYAGVHADRVKAVVLSGLSPWPTPTSTAVWRSRLPRAILLRLQSLEDSQYVTPAATPDSAQFAGMNPGVPLPLAGRLVHAGICDDVALQTTASWKDLPTLSELHPSAPVLVLQGLPRGDAPQPGSSPNASSDLQAVLPWTVVRELAGGGHDPWFSAPESTMTAIREFLSGRTDPTKRDRRRD